jgi:hypothetical protein
MEELFTAVGNAITQESLTAVLVLVTTYYAWQAHRSATMMKKQYEGMMRPYIVIRPIRDGTVYHLRIENTGQTSAEDFRLELSTPYHCNGEEEKNLGEEHLFTEGVDTFAPGAQVTYFLGTNFNILGDDSPEDTPLSFEVTARYSYAGEEVEEVTTVDLRQFADFALLNLGSDRDLKKGRKALETIADAVS